MPSAQPHFKPPVQAVFWFRRRAQPTLPHLCCKRFETGVIDQGRLRASDYLEISWHLVVSSKFGKESGYGTLSILPILEASITDKQHYCPVTLIFRVVQKSCLNWSTNWWKRTMFYSFFKSRKPWLVEKGKILTANYDGSPHIYQLFFCKSDF